MNISAKNTDTGKPVNKIAGVFVLSILITFLVISYVFVLVFGYIKGKEDAQKELLAFKDNITKIVSPTVSPTPTPRPIPTGPLVRREIIKWGGPELWQAVNNKRIEYGVNPLRSQDELCTIASIRLNELLELGKLDGHVGFGNLENDRPDLKWIFDKYSVIAEFLASGGKTPAETVSLWENTLGHKKLLSAGEYVWGCIYAQNTFSVAIVAY